MSFNADTFTVGSTPDTDPNAIPVKEDLLSELVEVTLWKNENNGKVKLGLKFRLDASVRPPYGNRLKDHNFEISHASEDNKYWMKMFWRDMGIPLEVSNAWVGLQAIVMGLRQYVGRKFVINARNSGGFINISTIRPYQNTQAQTLPAPNQTLPGAPLNQISTPVNQHQQDDPWATAAPAQDPTVAAGAPATAPVATAPVTQPAAPVATADPWAQAAQAAQLPPQQAPAPAQPVAGAEVPSQVASAPAPATATAPANGAAELTEEEKFRQLMDNL